MTVDTVAALAVLIFLAAMLYASVGHAGASGYLAAMALFGLAPEVMKPTALALNIVVAVVGTMKFYRTGAFSWRLLWPLIVTSIPLAFVGGMLKLPGYYYKPLVGAVLLYAAVRMALRKPDPTSSGREVNPPRLAVALPVGGVLGLLSGLTGVGGGIFLSPLLLHLNWAGVRATAATSVTFILVNSVSGLLGHAASLAHVPVAIAIWVPAALVGGYIGAEYGSKRLANRTILLLLAAVLLIAGLKMFIPERRAGQTHSAPQTPVTSPSRVH